MTEHALHQAVAQYLRLALRPPVYWTSIDHGAGKMSLAAAARAKARGVKAGLPDILVFVPRDGGGASVVIGIELKTPVGRLSTAQKETHEQMTAAGARCRVARSLEHVEDILRANGVPLHARAYADLRRAA